MLYYSICAIFVTVVSCHALHVSMYHMLSFLWIVGRLAAAKVSVNGDPVKTRPPLYEVGSFLTCGPGGGPVS